MFEIMPPGNLAVEDLGLDADDLRLELGVARPDLGEMLLDLQQPVLVEPRGVAGAFEHLDQRLGRIVARAQAERRDRRVDDVGAGLDRLHQADQRDAGRGVDVDVDQRCPRRTPP